MYVQPSAPRDIGGVIDDAIKLYRASFRTCWPIALIASVISAATVLYVVSRFPALATLRDPRSCGSWCAPPRCGAGTWC